MKKKIVKLTEENLINIIGKLIKEQGEDLGLAPFPEKKPTELGSEPEINNVKYGTHSAILKGKKIVKHHLEKAINAMEQLTAMTGINTDTNDVVPDIKKAYENFENLFGDPKPETSEDEIA